MVIDHKDGDASNNDLSNLRVHCPPCEAIRHCGFAGLQKWIIVVESTMEQVEIVRKTREMFENTGVIPHPKRIDPSVKPVDIGVLELANMMLKTPWKDLPEEFQRLRGFFTKRGSTLFQKTMMVTGNQDTYVCFPSIFLNRSYSYCYNNFLCREEPNDDSTEVLCNESDRKAAEIAAREAGLPWISYSEELHKSSQVFLESWPPSKTPSTQVAWICVRNPRSANSDDKSPLDRVALSSAWDKICAEGLCTLSEVDKLAEQFNVLSGKWLVFVSSDKVDNIWGRIVKSTLAGTIGTSAKVSPRDEEEPSSKHVICVYNGDYRSMEEVNRVRDALRRLGVKERIAYKPDIYTHCRIYQGNSWGITPSRYNS